MYENQYPVRKRRRRRRRRHNFLFPAMLVTVLLLAGCMGLFANDGPGDDVVPIRNEGTAGTSLPLDTAAPEIRGVQDFLLYVGETVSYFSGVTVTDDKDPAPALDVDSSGVNLAVPGTYTVTYTAADAAGNSSVATAAVTVLEKPADFVELDTIYDAADKLLETIVSGDETAEEQVHSIYSWARTQLGYGGHSDRTDWRQTAYTMLQEGSGDCFGYFAVTKLLFERLGIPNIDVRKVKNYEGDSDHFWSLVSVDGGKTYYHFDATPRVGDGDDFCLVTDAFLDAYSGTHKGSHNRDKSLYTATPEAGL